MKRKARKGIFRRFPVIQRGKSREKKRKESNTLFTCDEVVAVVYEERGIVTAIAESLGVSRVTVNSYRKRWKEVDEAIVEARSIIVDDAERSLLRLLEKDDVRATTYTLSTLGKSRGYVKSQDVNLNVGASKDTEELIDRALERIYGSESESTA